MGTKFETWLILNTKTKQGTFRVIKKRPRKLSYSEVAIKINLDIELPQENIMVAEGSVKLSSTKVAQMTIDALEEGTN